MAQRPRHKFQRLVGYDKGIGNHARLVVDHIGIPHPGQDLHGKYFLDRVFELYVGDRLSCEYIHHPHTAIPLVQRSLGDGDAAEHGGLAHLRQANEGQRTAKVGWDYS